MNMTFTVLASGTARSPRQPNAFPLGPITVNDTSPARVAA